MATLACTIDATGISAPSYNDIFAALQNTYLSIYGSDAVLTPDSQDGQLLAAFAQAINDCNQSTIAVYNSFSPSYAQGSGLSSVVKINGIQREIATASAVNVVIVGQAGTVITSGIVQDAAGNQWNMPGSVTIPVTGTVTVTATCATAGAIGAAAGTVTKIATPTLGWQSVTNPAAASIGNPVETDSALRQRQTISTSLPALTPLNSIISKVANISGVGRYAIYENPTSIVDSNGLPAHSISVVVEGGDATTIATTIEKTKSPGTDTYGTTSIIVQDPAGVPVAINFFQLAEIPVYAVINITPLTGYVATTGTSIQSTAAAFIEGLEIGTDVNLNKVLAPAGLQGNAATSSTGLTQTQLNALSETYDIDSIYLARSDMTTTGGPYVAGTAAVTVANPAPYSIGKSITLIASDSSEIPAVITSVSGSTLGFSPAIPAGKTVNNGSLVYLAGNLPITFNAAAQCTSSNVILNT
jgi:uncharacterized phage protein gp47/JayE